jgi:UTP--glucose-1-phosphate uridylyltransferase
MKIKKAIITAAGYGTRFFPLTKSIQKEMIPLLNKPLIDHLVDQCIEAGIEEIIFVVNTANNQIRKYYSDDEVLYSYLNRMGKQDKLDKIKNIPLKAKFTFITQPPDGQYGTAVPVMLAKEHVENEEAFLVLTGDDLFFNPDGTNEIKRMIEYFNQTNADGLITCIEVPDNEVHKYGIAIYDEVEGVRYLKDQIEKPEQVISNLVTISKYIYKPSIFQYFEGQQTDPKSGELYLTTTYKAMAQKEKVVLYTPSGHYLDSGDVFTWLSANLLLAKQNKELWDRLLEYIAKIKE